MRCSEKDAPLRSLSLFLAGNTEVPAVTKGPGDLEESVGSFSPGAALGAHGPDFHETRGVLRTMIHKIKTPLYVRAELLDNEDRGAQEPATAAAAAAGGAASSAEPRAAPPGSGDGMKVRIVGVKGGWGHCFSARDGGWSDRVTAMTVWRHLAKGAIWG